MAKLTVKNVGPIREAELEVKKHTVFIGPQGSGKSTLAKLIAIGGDNDILINIEELINKYSLQSYFGNSSFVDYNNPNYSLTYTEGFNVVENKIYTDIFIDEVLNSSGVQLDDNLRKSLPEVLTKKNLTKTEIKLKELFYFFASNSEQFFRKIIELPTLYIPSERVLLAILSRSIWSLINSDIDFPKSILSFASDFERIRNQIVDFHIPFLNVTYEHNQGEDILIHETGRISLSQSASGYQSIIPLLLVVDITRQRTSKRVIIEEPELNLYPTAQKDLIYSLMGGLQPDVEYKDAEWVITTHSPYVLSSFNILMLAYKVAQKSEELRAEVEKIIPSRRWINPDEFAAYYVDEGTVRSIINTNTGLIDENELDDVSDALADEQEALFALNRTARQPRA